MRQSRTRILALATVHSRALSASLLFFHAAPYNVFLNIEILPSLSPTVCDCKKVKLGMVARP